MVFLGSNGDLEWLLTWIVIYQYLLYLLAIISLVRSMLWILEGSNSLFNSEVIWPKTFSD